MKRAPLYDWEVEVYNKKMDSSSPEEKLKYYLKYHTNPYSIDDIDQDMIIEMVNANYDWLPNNIDDLRVVAISKLNAKHNHDFLFKIIQHERNREIRCAAIKKINYTKENEEYFTRLAIQGYKEAINKIHDDKNLLKIVTSTYDETCRKIAFKKITDQSILTKIVISTKDEICCISAFEKISDESMLIKIALECRFYDIRGAATEKISDIKILEQILNEDSSEYVRICAEERINYLKNGTSKFKRIFILDKKDFFIVRKLEKKYHIKFIKVKKSPLTKDLLIFKEKRAWGEYSSIEEDLPYNFKYDFTIESYFKNTHKTEDKEYKEDDYDYDYDWYDGYDENSESLNYWERDNFTSDEILGDSDYYINR